MSRRISKEKQEETPALRSFKRSGIQGRTEQSDLP
jgi:hypothetical protein